MKIQIFCAPITEGNCERDYWVMHQSILALPTPPPPPPRAFALFFCPGAGHWYLQSCPGGGELFTGRAFDSTGRYCDEHVLL